MNRRGLVVLFLFILSCAGSRGPERKQTELMLREHKLAVEMEPQNPLTHLALGDVYLEKGDFDSALVCYNTALNLSPGLNPVLVQKGKALWLQGDKKGGSDAFKSVLYSPEASAYVDQISRFLGCPYKIKRLSDGKGQNAFPNISMTGDKVIFQSDRDGNWNIYLMEIDGENLKQLTKHWGRDEAPVLSPDGMNFAFTSTRDDTQHTTLDDLKREIYLGSVETGDIARLTTNDADDWSPVFSPNGLKLLFLSDRSDSCAHIYEMDLQTGECRQVTQVRDKKALGDYNRRGSMIYFSSDGSGKYVIKQLQLSRGQEKTVVETCEEQLGVKCGHIEEQLVFFAKMEDNYDIYRADMETGEIQRLTCSDAVDAFPVFSSGDNSILFHSDRDKTFQIFLIDLIQPQEVTGVLDYLRAF